MTPALLSPPAPLSPTSSAIPRVDSALRLGLYPVLDRRAVVDGAWWPYSRDAATELPGLIAAVDRLLGRVTLRIGLHGDAWQSIPHRIPARGRQVRIGWFRHTDPRLITLVFAAGEPVVLLVIPPDTAAGPAEATLKLTAQDTAGWSVDDALTGARLPPDPVRPMRGTAADGTARWENEGGSVTDQQPPSGPDGHRHLRDPRSVCRPGQTVVGPARSGGGPVSSRQASHPHPASRKGSALTVIDPAPLGVADPSKPTTVRLSGEIDIFTSAALRRQLLSTLHYSTSLLILDLSQVSFCDAGGVGVLVGIQRRARSMGITLALKAPRPFMSRLLHNTGLDRSLPMTV
ncbi:STAS domain-containing protein [Nonomuraea mesophila]|uniref:STAS domain-containing protein n=1 Tax=Nonomuraea mesophila TaxID=2530382 RepID=UPI001C704643|nr:STAS domain-containing protein [Nonomuraea mesophila]